MRITFGRFGSVVTPAMIECPDTTRTQVTKIIAIARRVGL